MSKTRINLSLDADLASFAKDFAAENRTTVSEVFTQYLLGLKRHAMGRPQPTFLADPAFNEALAQAQQRLQQGKASWSSFDEVFKEP
ncbi:MAG: DUF6364 family protein [bacterium]|nr:DUF6364 family protein [bacterium]